MAPESTANWRELPRSVKSQCPKLFYSFAMGTDAFTLRLTDLVAIWECASVRPEIIEAAKLQRSSIDPSESTIQFSVLLEKLDQSLASGGNHLFRAEGDSLQTVYIQTNLDLPRPLKPLLWIFELIPQDASELAEQLLRPCLREASISKQKIESLLRVIKDKDHVITRLLEKMETSMTDLSLIFPGITGLKSRKGRVTTQEAQKHVPGMAEFETIKWSTHSDKDDSSTGFDQMGMNSLVAGCERCPKHTTKEHTSWLKGLPVRGTDIDTSSPELDGSTKARESKSARGGSSSETESDFERQPTPPHLKKPEYSKKFIKRRSSKSDSSSGGEQERPSKRARLGKIGGKDDKLRASSKLSTSAKDENLIPRSRTTNKSQKESRNLARRSSDSESETASDAENSNGASASNAANRSEPQRDIPSSKPRKLGRLASQASNSEQISSRSTSPTQENNNESSQKQQTQSPLPKRTKPPSTRNTKSQPVTSPPAGSETDDDDLGSSSIKAPITRSKDKLSDQTKDHTNTTAKSTPSSNPTTPSRRLGRLGRHNTASQPPSSENPTPTKIKKSPGKSDNTSNVPVRSDEETETETASSSDSDAGPNDAEPSLPNTRNGSQNRSQLRRGDSALLSTEQSYSTPVSEPEPEPMREETVEERANRRREELKQRLNTTAVNKRKRKF